MATRVAQIGITLLAAAVLGTVWLLWVGTSPMVDPSSVPGAARLSARLPSNKVAVVIRESGPAAVGAVAQVGDRVDVLGYFPSQAGRPQPTTRVLLQDVTVYATGHDGDIGALMVGVAPDEVRLVQESTQQGAKIIFRLRSAQDTAAGAAKDSLTDAELASWLGRN